VFTRRNNKLRQWLLIATLVLVLDQVSKIFILMMVGINNKVALMPSLNKGAAFGLLSDANGWQRWLFMLIAILVSTGIVVWLATLKTEEKWDAFALALILGGALGNMLDRIIFAQVVDFIDFYIGSWHWYTFNVADIAICVGAAIMICTSFKKS
jgi:signal peptidase II